MLIKYPFVTIHEIWFDPSTHQRPADIARYRQVPTLNGLSFNSEQSTLLLDLLVSEDSLLKASEKDTRYDIRRAERDRVEVQFFSSAATDKELLDNICSFYARFARQKSLRKMNRRRLEAARRANRLWLSRSRAANGEDLVWHIYIVGSERARLLHSASLYRAASDPSFRTLVGRANRYLHWRDILAFKQQGKSIYDFGGWYEGRADEDLLRVNQFKREFGGTKVVEFNGYRFLTLRGRAIGLTLQLKKSAAKTLRRRTDPASSSSAQMRVGPPGFKSQVRT